MAAWQTDGCNVAGLQSWEIKRREFPNKVQFLRRANGSSPALGPTTHSHTEALQAISKAGAPTKALTTNVCSKWRPTAAPHARYSRARESAAAAYASDGIWPGRVRSHRSAISLWAIAQLEIPAMAHSD